MLLGPWEFSRQEYWDGLPYPPPGDLPDPGVKSASLMSPALADSVTWEAPIAQVQLQISGKRAQVM